MEFNSPLPKNLKGECDKAAQIIREFTIPTNSAGPDSLIPTGILAAARGIAIISVFKIGFLMSIRGGSGVVIVRLSPTQWSAPSAVGLGGLGGGFEIGAQVTDLVILLNTEGAVESFMKGGNVTLGGSLSVAAGPYGRMAEADVAVRNVSAFYTYSKSRGLFGGISLEAACFVERKGANRKLYGSDVRARDLLQGKIECPPEAHNLVSTLNAVLLQHVKEAGGQALNAAASHYGLPPPVHKSQGRPPVPAYSKPAASHSGGGGGGKSTARASSGASQSGAGKGADEGSDGEGEEKKSRFASFKDRLSSATKRGADKADTVVLRDEVESFTSQQRNIQEKFKHGVEDKSKPKVGGYVKPRAAAGDQAGDEAWNSSAEPVCKAMYDFKGELPCDLSFKRGDIITILTRTGDNDWWEGKVKGHGDKVGIFPSCYVKVS